MHAGIVVVVLKPNVAIIGAKPAIRFVPDRFLGDWVALSIIGNEVAIDLDFGAGAIKRNDHVIPFLQDRRNNLLRFGEAIETASTVPFIGVIADLDFVALVHALPRIFWRIRHADEDSGIIVESGEFKNYSNAAVAKFPAGVPKQAHAAVSDEHPIFEAEFARSAHLPPIF